MFVLPAHSKAGDFTLSLHGETGLYAPPKNSFLARRVTGTPGTEQFDFAKTDGKEEYHAFGIGFSYSFNDQYTLKGSIGDANMIDKQNFGALDPDGLALLIPGVGVGPNGEGFELPPALNQTADTYYRNKSDSTKIELAIEKKTKKKFLNCSITPNFGMQYQHFQSDTSFDGSVPLFLREFGYQTDIDVHSIRPFIGVDITYPLSDTIIFNAGGRYLYDINIGNGTDSLDFTGFARQTAKMNGHDNTHSAEANIGLNFTITDTINFDIGARYSNAGNIPIMKTRTGTSPSKFDYEHGKVMTGLARLSVKF